MPKVSIIIPIYKKEKYLPICLDSVLSQTYTDWECILVDDGSPDNSGAICDSYANKDCRFHVVHKKNGGSSAARNAGIEKASGEWIMMVDGDDWIEKELLNKCLSSALLNKSDFVKTGMRYEYGRLYKDFFYQKNAEKNQFIKDLLSRSVLLSVCCGLYKRSLFDKLEFPFSEGLNFGEDYSVIARLLYVANRFSIIDEPLYHYRIVSSGYVGSANFSSVEQLIGCEKINYDFFYNRDGGIYNLALNKGRSTIKAYAIGMLLKDPILLQEKYTFINGLYKESIDLRGCSFENRLLLTLSKSRLLLRVLSPFWRCRLKMSAVLKKIL